MPSKSRKRRRLLIEQLQRREFLDASGLMVADDRFEVRQGSPAVEMALLANDTFEADYDGDQKITSSSFGSRGGLIRIAEDGQSVTYELPADFAGTETFKYYIDFEHQGTVTVEIQSPLGDDRFTVNPDGQQVTLSVLANDSMWDNYEGAGRITAVSHTRLGGEIRVSDDGTQILYTATEYETGKDTFVYFVDDIFSAVVRVDIIDPLAEDRVLDIINETGTRRIDVLANDPFFEGYQGERRITQILDNRGLSVGGESIFSIADGGMAIDVSTDDRAAEPTVTRTVRYVVDNQYEGRLTVQLNSPVRDDYYRRFYNNVIQQPISVLHNDIVRYRDERYSTLDPRGYIVLDLADRITGVGDSQLGGIVEVAADGQHVLYTPAAGATGNERFDYTVDGRYVASVRFYLADPPSGGGGTGGSGGGGGSSTTRSKFCRPAPDLHNLNQNDGPTRLDVLANDFQRQGFECDPYPGSREITEIRGPRNGTVTVAEHGGSLVYTPHEDFYGTDSFVYVVDNNLSAGVTIDVVRRVRDDQFRVAPDTSDNTLNVTGNDLFGAAYEGPELVTEVLASEQGAEITIGDDRETILYTPAAGFVGEDHFRYVVDGQLKAEVSIFVSPSKDDLLRRQDETVFWDALIFEAIEDYAHLFGQEAYPIRGYRDSDILFDIATTSNVVTLGAEAKIFSETNVQVAGVDEADLIETDGDNLYVLRDHELIITRAWPAGDLDLLSRIEIEGNPIGMYWQGDRLAVVSEVISPQIYYNKSPSYSTAQFSPGYGLVPSWFYPPPALPSVTIVTVLDVADATGPTIVHKTHLDGGYVESRRIDDSVFLVLRNDPVRMPVPLRIQEIVAEDGSVLTIAEGNNTVNLNEILDTAQSSKQRYESSEEYIARMTPLLSELLPNFESYDGEGNLVRAGLIVAPGDFYEPLGENRSVVTIASINMAIDEPGISGSTAVLTSGSDDIYASSESLYVMDRAYTAEDGDVTKILKFVWNGTSGEIDFVSLGQVAGYTLDQFSLDEFDGHFRLATTMSNLRVGNRSGDSENAVWVLQDNGGLLQIVGDLQNVGLTERIKSVRFMGERAFVTTFRKIDPLFALDLSDHANPTRVGYVTLPGYNSYMQPIDANHLLTIGHNGITEGIGSSQVILFDISEITRPRIVGRHSFYLDSTSIAEQDHHAFGWFAPHNVLSIPLVQNRKERVDTDHDGYKETWIKHREDQLAVLEIDVAATIETRDGVELRGTIENDSAVVRSAFINDVLYSIAHNSIIAADINDPTSLIATVDLRPAVPVDSGTAPTDLTPLDPNPVQLRNQRVRARIARAQRVAIERIGSTVAPPVLLALEGTANSRKTSFVFDSAGKKMLVTVDANEVASLVSSDFHFETRRVNRHQNPINNRDVNDDGLVTHFDVLRIVNEINNHGPHALSDGNIVRQIASRTNPPADYLDVDGNGVVNAIDVLVTVNWINAHRHSSVRVIPDIASAEGEGETGQESLGVTHDQAVDAIFGSANSVIPATYWGAVESTDDENDPRASQGTSEPLEDTFFESILSAGEIDD